MSEKSLTTSLVVDKLNRIVAVDDQWLHEAEKGQAEIELVPENILENFLADFIQDDNTTMYVEAILSLCRLRNERIYRPYRCDSPTHQRFMELELIPMQQGQVKMVHYLLKEVPFSTPITIEDVSKDSTPVTQTGYYLRCSMCNSLKAPGQQEWKDPSEIGSVNLSHFRVIHTVCEHCANVSWKRRSILSDKKPN